MKRVTSGLLVFVIGVLVTNAAEAAPPPQPPQDVRVVNTAPVPVSVGNESLDVLVQGPVEVTGSGGLPVPTTNVGPAIPYQVQKNQSILLSDTLADLCVTWPAGYRFVIETVTAQAYAGIGQRVIFQVVTTFASLGEPAFAAHGMPAELQGQFDLRDLFMASEAMKLYADDLLCGSVRLTAGYVGIGVVQFSFSGYLVPLE